MLSHKPLIIVDSYIPFLEGLLEPYADVRVLAPDQITADAVRDADALLVRTRTRCNADLLSGSRVRFVGTATIGLDHIDQKWCADNGITAVNAPGCNAPAVAQYVFAALAQLINRPIQQYTMAIMGVGHVGSVVERWARALDMKVLLYDPPRARAEGSDGFATLEQVCEQADIITMHTPLTRVGQDASYHIVNTEFLSRLRRAPIFINAARGAVVDTPALMQAIRLGQVSATAIDTWEGEPLINTALMDMVDIATPHIAGYSHEGKVRATRMVLDSLCQTLGLPHIKLNVAEPPAPARAIRLRQLADSYDILADDRLLRSAFPKTADSDGKAASRCTDPKIFEALRDYYPLRPEAPEALPD